MSLENKPCHVGVEYSDRIPFYGTYAECKEWIITDDPYDECDYGIISNESGRFLSVVWQAYRMLK